MCLGNLTLTGSDNGLSPSRRQAIIWTNARILLIWTLGTKFSEILIKILRVSLKKMRLKGSSAKWQPFCLSLSVLRLHLFRNEISLQWKYDHKVISLPWWYTFFWTYDFNTEFTVCCFSNSHLPDAEMSRLGGNWLEGKYLSELARWFVYMPDREYGSRWALPRLIIGLCPANESHHHLITMSLIGWVQT